MPNSISPGTCMSPMVSSRSSTSLRTNSKYPLPTNMLKRRDDSTPKYQYHDINIMPRRYFHQFVRFCYRQRYLPIFAINYLIKLMPPKKKADVKADKADKLKPKPSASKSPVKSTPKAADSKLKSTRSKDKIDPAPQPEPVPAKGRRSARQPSPVPDPAPVKKTKGAKSPEPKAPEPPKSGKKDPQPKTDKKDDTAKVQTKPTATDDKDKDNEQQIVKVVTKGGVAVDNEVVGKENYRVYQEGGKTYAVTLNLADLQQNNNKFYIVQMLLNEKNGSLYVWNRWGRVGVAGQNCLKGPMTKDKAIQQYSSKVREKTGKGYREIEIKYDDQQEKPKTQTKAKVQKDVASKMDSALVNLISLIFDVNVMNNTMKEIGYDAKKMPLGKLGESTIKEAYNVLNRLTKAIENRQTSQYSKLSSEFYTLIPHNIGFEKMSKFILDNDEKVKQKIRMLQAISDMKITSKLLDQQGDQDTSVHDQNYKKLGCNIKSLVRSSEDFKLLKEYFDNTKGSFTQVTVGDIYQVERPTEFTSFNSKLGNNMLLWHGSRIANFVGILSQGLRIAPPEAPVSGYLFGKGIYLADLAEKSIHYCRSGTSPKALILLIEGALGNPNILLTSSYQAKQLMERNGKHSTKCHGAKAPPQSSYVNFKGMIVPNGKPTATSSGSYMGHNEFIVYNMNQARIRYIIEMNMNGS